MTDRHSGYIVVLADDVREDDAEEGVLNAIRMIRGVIKVTPVIAEVDHQIGEARARQKIREQIMDVLFAKPLDPKLVSKID